MSAALGQLKCKRLITLHLRSTAPTINDLHINCASLFFCKGVRDLNGTLRKQHGALFLVPGVIATALAAQKRRTKRLRPQGCGASPIDRTNIKDDNVIVFFSFSAKNDAALPLISKNSFQSHPNPNRHRLSRLNYCVFIKNVH